MLTKKDKDLINRLKNLPINYWDFKEEDTKSFTHGIHNYPAIMVAPISRNIIKIMKDYIDIKSLFDPFCGSGTVLVEGMLANIPNITGNDINPLALFISHAKTQKLNLKELHNEIIKLERRINYNRKKFKIIIDNINFELKSKYNLDYTSKENWGNNAYFYLNDYYQKNNIKINIPNFKNMGYWFKPQVITSLSIIKEEIQKIKRTDNFIKRFFPSDIDKNKSKEAYLKLLKDKNGEFYKKTTNLINKLENIKNVKYEEVIKDTNYSGYRENVIQDFLKLIEKFGGITNQEILPFWVVFEGDITRDPKRVREIAFWFDKYYMNYFMWRPGVSGKKLIEHFNKYLKKYLD